MPGVAAAAKIGSTTMASPFPFSLAVLAAVIAGGAGAVESTLAPGGFTGLSITPNAHLLGWGSAAFSYDAQLPGVISDPSGHNFVLGFGLLPNVEVVGRLAANSIHANCFFGCGARDLSVSAKAGIGLDTANRFRIAAGVTDVGGAATFFRGYYGVLTFNEGPWELSGGFARRSGAGVNGSRSPLHGPFAGAAWQPASWVRGHVETSDGQAWAGVRLMAPGSWLPQGWSASVGATARLTQTSLTERSWISATLTIPLYKVPAPAGQRQGPLPVLADTQRPLPAYEARALPESAPAPVAPVAAAAAAASDAALHLLAEALRARGLEDISIGRMPDHSLAVRANNATYNWNSLDALGAALGAIAQTMGDTRSVYRLVLTQRQVPLVAVTGRADCLRQWVLGQEQSCTAGELSTPGTQDLALLHQGAEWLVNNVQPSWKTLRVALSPVLRTSIGTEFGAFDYSAGVSAAFVQPLWRGATAEWRVQQELARSTDYAQEGIFYRRRVVSGTDRLVVTQTLRLPLERLVAGDPVAIRRWGLAAVTGHAVAGRIGGDFDGALAAVRWEPGEGRHRVTLQAGAFRHARFGTLDAVGPRRAVPLLGSYRYNVAPTRTYLEATAGRFMFNDLGYQVGMRQWFSDVAVSLFYRHSRFADQPARRFAGIQVSVPIGPRKDMNPGGLQVTGTPRFTHGAETVVRDPTGSNAVVQGFGVVPPAPDLEGTFNSDRASLIYFEDNMGRIRDAAR
jgi:hypothetical protein